MKNFPFYKDGEELWYSRSIAVVTFIYCKDENDNWNVLLNLRGKGLPNEVGKWNSVSGYLDFDEDLAQCAVREIHEETGLILNRHLINFFAINSIPDSQNQVVSILHYVILPGKTSDYEDLLSNKDCESGEVEDIGFFPISMLLTSDIELAFNHKNLIIDIYNKRIANNKV